MNAVQIIRIAEFELDHGRISLEEYLNRVSGLEDVEQVVRCRNCKFWKDVKAQKEQDRWLPCMEMETERSWYCASGVFKTKDVNK